MATLQGENHFSLSDSGDDDPYYPIHRTLQLPGQFGLTLRMTVAGDRTLPITLPPTHPVTIRAQSTGGDPLEGTVVRTEELTGITLAPLWPEGPALESAVQQAISEFDYLRTNADGELTFYPFETSRMKVYLSYNYGDGLTFYKTTPLFAVYKPRTVTATLGG